jgi:hypothetical protein
MDWLKRFFNDPATVGILASSGLIGLVVGIANGVVQKKHGGWSGFFGALVTGTVIAVIVGLGIDGYVKSETLRLAIIGACAVISDDIWAGLKSLGGGLRTDPFGTITRILDALRARPAASQAPKE